MAGGQEPIGKNVTTESTEIVAGNHGRQWLVVVNASDTNMWIAVDADAILNKGILLTPGGVLVISRKGDMFSNGPVNGIHGGSGNKLATAQEALE